MGTYLCSVPTWSGIFGDSAGQGELPSLMALPETALNYVVVELSGIPGLPGREILTLHLAPDDFQAQPVAWLFGGDAPLDVAYPVLYDSQWPIWAYGAGPLLVRFRGINLTACRLGETVDTSRLHQQLMDLVPGYLLEVLEPVINLAPLAFKMTPSIISQTDTSLKFGISLPIDGYLAALLAIWPVICQPSHHFNPGEFLQQIYRWCSGMPATDSTFRDDVLSRWKGPAAQMRLAARNHPAYPSA